ncbi:glutathione S-transferase family protein [Veronia pacifica]|uniref:GST N-terminal domain-containing protein n=1 Tax=Veronia pacifica TaxID=1080227 RepID=A0A1C3ESG2_9GAMM|nr:glutathione S-transferase family protein [Veronia pacifica]ODA36222.1 hypothetical protein A8L45_01055 [Veronia pacifica]
MLTLFGSHPSPYVRRIRILLAERDFEFIPLNIFGSEDRAVLTKINPTLKIPMLDDDGQIIFDSSVIYRYLSEKYTYPVLDWQQENLLTCINTVNDTMVQVMTMKRSGFKTGDDKFVFNLQRERAGVLFNYLDDQAARGQFSEWDFPSIALYCLLDWVNFRSLHDWSEHTNLCRFFQQHEHRAAVLDTIPHD